jgi:hypothetical protein
VLIPAEVEIADKAGTGTPSAPPRSCADARLPACSGTPYWRSSARAICDGGRDGIALFLDARICAEARQAVELGSASFWHSATGISGSNRPASTPHSIAVPRCAAGPTRSAALHQVRRAPHSRLRDEQVDVRRRKVFDAVARMRCSCCLCLFGFADLPLAGGQTVMTVPGCAASTSLRFRLNMGVATPFTSSMIRQSAVNHAKSAT